MGAINWGVGGALAGLAGVLLAPIIGVCDRERDVLTVTVLAAALIGGLRSFPLTLAGGMVIGMPQSLFGIHDLGIPGLADAVPFVVIIAVIVLRGRRLPLRSFVGERLPRVGSGEIRIGWVVAGVAVVVVLIGWVLNDNGTAALTTSLLAAIPLLSLTVLLGYAGQMSLAQITLSGVGGLIAARLAANVGLPFPVVLLLAHAGHGSRRPRRGAAVRPDARGQPRGGDARPSGGDPVTGVQQRLDRRGAGRDPAPEQRVVPSLRHGLRQLPARRPLRVSGPRLRGCSGPAGGQSAAQRAQDGG